MLVGGAVAHQRQARGAGRGQLALRLQHVGLRGDGRLVAVAGDGIGAFVASTEEIVNFLRYNMRSQTFAKALPMPMVMGLHKRFDLLKSNPELRDKLWTISKALQTGLQERGFDTGVTETMVTPVFLKGELHEATALTMDLRKNYGIFCSIVVYPVIPKGLIQLRLIPTAVHTLEDVERTLTAFTEVGEKLNSGFYKEQKVAYA